MDLHVGLELVGLPELPGAYRTLIGFLSRVHQQVAVVVLRRPELFPALFTPVGFDPGVQQLVLLQLRRQHKSFLTDAADVRPVAAVLPQVVQVQVSQVEGFPTWVAGELFVLGVTLLMRPQRGAAAEALQTDFTAERFDSARPPSPCQSFNLHSTLPSISTVVNQLLVFLQLTVVEKRLPAQITHERLLHTVDQHVGLQSPGPCKPLPTFITPERERANTWLGLLSCVPEEFLSAVLCICIPEGSLSVMEPQVSLEVVLESKTESAGLTHERFFPGVDHPVLQQTHLTLEGLIALTTFERPLL